MPREIPPPIEQPCPQSWDAMTGDAKRRFCAHCQLHVHNLSAMSAAERTEILCASGQRCVTYTVDGRGRLLTRPARPGIFAHFRVGFMALVATVIPFAVTSCVTRTGKPAPPFSEARRLRRRPSHRQDRHDRAGSLTDRQRLRFRAANFTFRQKKPPLAWAWRHFPSSRSPLQRKRFVPASSRTSHTNWPAARRWPGDTGHHSAESPPS